MRNRTQTDGRKPFPARPERKRLASGLFRLAWVCLAWMLLPCPVFAQSFRLGMVDWFLQAKTEVGFDSNVDDVYPEEIDPYREKSDFYWMPGLTLRSAPLVMAPRTTYNLNAGIAYQDYFARNDLDTALYNAQLSFQTATPRLTLGGMGGMDYAADGIAESYVPGGVGRDPTLTHMANVYANLLYRALQLNSRVDFTSERHDLEKYWDGDQDETVLFAGAQLNPLTKLALNASWQKTITLLTLSGEEKDETKYAAGATLNLFSWGGLFYTWEKTITLLNTTDLATEETVSTFGLTGAIPIELIRHPRITYALGLSYEEEETDETGVIDKKWEPTHTITASDDFQISRSLRLSGSATWQSDLAGNAVWQQSEIETDEITFIYNILLEHQLAPKVRHALTFTQEPEPTFGSTTDTKTTTYGYDFKWGDLLVKGLDMSFNASYEESTPLEEAAETEQTTLLTFGLVHTRPLSRKLNRIISYQYTQEDSNFHDAGPRERHLAIYGFTYDF